MTATFPVHFSVPLFAASNDGFELDNNDAPAGLPAANLITVGGLDSCNYEIPYSESSTGPGIDIAAPATEIPVGDPGPDQGACGNHPAR